MFEGIGGVGGESGWRTYYPEIPTVSIRAAVELTLFEPRFSLTAGFCTFKSAAPRFYKLPLDIKRIEDMKNFKRKLKTYLF